MITGSSPPTPPSENANKIQCGSLIVFSVIPLAVLTTGHLTSEMRMLIKATVSREADLRKKARECMAIVYP